jgi:fermentation-respiration switch protein FrsA (DUF1100 family)
MSLVPEMREITLLTSDGLSLYSWYYKGDEDKPIIIYFQGNAGTIFDRDYKARYFIDLGYSFLMLGYRGYGGNSGDPSESGFNIDGEAALEFAKNSGFNIKQTILYGESLGTGVSVNLAINYDIHSLILEAPYTSIEKIASERYWFVPVHYLLKDKFNSLSKIGNIEAPLLIIHGGQDKVINLKYGKELFFEASEPKKIHVFKSAGHANLFDYKAGEVVNSFILSRK